MLSNSVAKALAYLHDDLQLPDFKNTQVASTRHLDAYWSFLYKWRHVTKKWPLF